MKRREFLKTGLVGIVLASSPIILANTVAMGSEMLDLAWSPPVGGTDHYRLEISKTDFNEQPLVSYAYTKINQFQIEIEEGFIYEVRVQAVNSYGSRSEFTEKITFSLEDISPQSLSLSQNQPNPFNSSTIIKYQLPENTKVNLDIYNISGQKIKSLVDRIESKGLHQVKFDGNGLSSGVYFYKLTTPNSVKIEKMMLVK